MRGRAVVLVDDGLATGFTMRAAIVAARDQGAALLVVAVPVGSAEACAELSLLANEVICPLQPEPFHAVGLWYDKFLPTSDDEVKKCLAANHTMRESRGGSERWR